MTCPIENLFLESDDNYQTNLSFNLNLLANKKIENFELEMLNTEKSESQRNFKNSEHILENLKIQNIEENNANMKKKFTSREILENISNQNIKKPLHWTFQKKNFLFPQRKMKSDPIKRSFSFPTQQINVSSENISDIWKNIDNGVKFSLPIRNYGASDSIPRINSIDLSNIIEKEIEICIIDCRFDYEYKAGHIKNAINIDNIEKLKKSSIIFKDKILIFYCEFSSVRAPRLAKYLRNYDRFNNEYPNLDFPEIYILEGGYKRFFESHDCLCVPKFYLPMK